MRAVELKQLREDKSSRSRAEKQHVNSDRWVELVQPVDGTRGRFEQCRLFISQVMNFVAFLLVAVQSGSVARCRVQGGGYVLDDVLCKTAIQSHTTCVEVLAQYGFTTSTVEAIVALRVDQYMSNVGI